jgi:hypothetical protein
MEKLPWLGKKRTTAFPLNNIPYRNPRASASEKSPKVAEFFGLQMQVATTVLPRQAFFQIPGQS